MNEEMDDARKTAVRYGFNDELGSILEISTGGAADQMSDSVQKAEIAEAILNTQKKEKS